MTARRVEGVGVTGIVIEDQGMYQSEFHQRSESLAKMQNKNFTIRFDFYTMWELADWFMSSYCFSLRFRVEVNRASSQEERMTVKVLGNKDELECIEADCSQ